MNNTDVERWFEGLPLSAAEFFRICDKCKYAIRINGGRHEYHYLGKCKPEARDSSEPRQFQPTGGGTAHMGYERCGRCGFKLSEHGSPGFQCPATGTPPLKMADEPTASEPTNWNAMGYCAKHQAPMLDHEGCYVCKTAVTLPPMTERQTDWQIASPKAEPTVETGNADHDLLYRMQPSATGYEMKWPDHKGQPMTYWCGPADKVEPPSLSLLERLRRIGEIRGIIKQLEQEVETLTQV